MTPDEEIRLLAALIADIAYRCWHDLGTDESKRIVVSALKVEFSADARITLAAKQKEK